MNRENNHALKPAIIVIALIALLAITVALILQAVWLREQIAKFGFYKEDVLLNYGRHVARIACVLGAILSGASALSIFIGIIDQKLSIY